MQEILNPQFGIAKTGSKEGKKTQGLNQNVATVNSHNFSWRNLTGNGSQQPTEQCPTSWRNNCFRLREKRPEQKKVVPQKSGFV